MSAAKQNPSANIIQYRKVIKYLKGKYKALEKTNQYLSDQVARVAPASENKLLSKDLIDRECISEPFKNFFLYNHSFESFMACVKEKFGDNFSLEMVFRMLDRNYEDKISSDDMTKFLKTTLRISEAQIIRIILIFDENCNGVITKENYIKALDSFKCRNELLEQNEDISDPLRFSLDKLLKPLAEKLCNLKVTPLKYFQIATKSRENADFMTYTELENIWKGDLFQLKELDLKDLNMIVVVFDPNYHGKFDKFSFIDTMNKFLKRILSSGPTDKRYLDSCSKELASKNEEKLKMHKGNSEIEEDEEELHGDEAFAPQMNMKTIEPDIDKNEKNLEKKSSNKQKKKNQENVRFEQENEEKEGRTIIIFDQQDSLQGDQELPQNYINPKKQEKNKILPDVSGQEIVMTAAQKSGKHLYLCFQAILEDSANPEQGFTVNEIFSKLDYYYGAYLNKKAKIDILRSIDLNNNGVYDFYEVKEFFLECCKGKISVKTLLLVFAKELQARNMKTTEIFILNDLDVNMRLDLKRFVEVLKSIMNLEFSELSAIFLEICDENAEITLKEFIDIINNLRNDITVFNEPSNKDTTRNEDKTWGLRVTKNHQIRSVILKFSLALKEKKITSKELFKRANADNKDKKTQNIVKLAKIGETLKRIFPDRENSEITEFLDTLDCKKTAMISFEEFDRIMSFEDETLELKALSDKQKEDMKEKLNEFLEQKNLNMVQFFEILDREKKDLLDITAIKEGLLSQGFDYMDASIFINIFDLNHDGFVEKLEFLDTLAFKNPQKPEVKFKNTPITIFTSSVADDNDETISDSFKKTALKKLQTLILYTNEYKIYFSKTFGKYEGINSFAITRQEFSEFLRSIPKSATNQAQNLSDMEIIWLCKEADIHRRNRIMFMEYLNWVKTLTFDTKKKGEEMDKINKFIQEEKENDPFQDPREEFEKHKRNIHSSSNKKDKNTEADNLHIPLNEDSLKSLDKSIEVSQELKQEEKVMQKEKKEEIIKKKRESFVEQKKLFEKLIMEKTSEITNQLKPLAEEFKQMKSTKTDLFLKESKYYITMFVNPLVCLKSCLEDALSLNKNEKWKDPEFGPTNADPSGMNSIITNTNKMPANFPDSKLISWKRAEEIVGFPIFTDTQHPFHSHIVQGELGDSWFLGALFLLSSQQSFILGSQKTEKIENFLTEGIYPKIFHFLRFYGIFVFRFYKDFQWVYVVIDDRFPCVEDENHSFIPLFGGNENNNEFWVSLIEKAYAKLHYSYQNLESGHTNSSLKDLTGLGIKSLPMKFAKPDDFFYLLNNFISREALLSCSKWGLDVEANVEQKEEKSEVALRGLNVNLNYNVLCTIELEDNNCKNTHKSHRLLLIRNPISSKVEGVWGLNSAKFKKYQTIIKEKSTFPLNENNFLLRFKDFRGFFDEVYAIYEKPKDSRVFMCADEWTKNNSGGPPISTDPKALKNWLKNPKYFFKIERKNKGKTKFYIEMSQFDPRLIKKAEFPFTNELNYLFFMVMKHDNLKKRKIEKFDNTKIAYSSNLVKTREISDEIVLENGGYVLVVNSQQAGALGKFFIKIITECIGEEIMFFEDKFKEEVQSIKISEKDKQLLGKIPQECI